MRSAFWSGRFGTRAIRALIDSGRLQIVRSSAAIQGNHGDVAGLYIAATEGNNWRVYLNLAHLTNETLAPTLIHELGVHHGLNEMLGEEQMREFSAMAAERHGAEWERARNWVDERYAHLGQEFLDRFRNEEVLARFIQENGHRPLPLIKRIFAAIRDWLRRNGWPIEFSDSDIVWLASDSLTKVMAAEVASTSTAGRPPPPRPPRPPTYAWPGRQATPKQQADSALARAWEAIGRWREALDNKIQHGHLSNLPGHLAKKVRGLLGVADGREREWGQRWINEVEWRLMLAMPAELRKKIQDQGTVPGSFGHLIGEFKEGRLGSRARDVATRKPLEIQVRIEEWFNGEAYSMFADKYPQKEGESDKDHNDRVWAHAMKYVLEKVPQQHRDEVAKGLKEGLSMRREMSNSLLNLGVLSRGQFFKFLNGYMPSLNYYTESTGTGKAEDSLKERDKEYKSRLMFEYATGIRKGDGDPRKVIIPVTDKHKREVKVTTERMGPEAVFYKLRKMIMNGAELEASASAGYGIYQEPELSSNPYLMKVDPAKLGQAKSTEGKALFSALKGKQMNAWQWVDLLKSLDRIADLRMSDDEFDNLIKQGDLREAVEDISELLESTIEEQRESLQSNAEIRKLGAIILQRGEKVVDDSQTIRGDEVGILRRHLDAQLQQRLIDLGQIKQRNDEAGTRMEGKPDLLVTLAQFTDTTAFWSNKDPDDGSWLRQLIGKATDASEDLRPNIDGARALSDKEDWRQVPNTRRYGRLRGYRVHPDVWREINHTQLVTGFAAKYIWATAPGGARDFHRYWKTIKVAGSLPTVARNIITNFMFVLPYYNYNVASAFAAMGRVAKAYIQFYQGKQRLESVTDPDMRRMISALSKYGVHASSQASQEFWTGSERHDLSRLFRDLDASPAGVYDTLVHKLAGRNLARLGNFYQGLELVGKGAIFLQQYKEEMQLLPDETPAGGVENEVWKGEKAAAQRLKWIEERAIRNAVDEAQMQLFNYRRVPHWIVYARSSLFFGSPFITFRYKTFTRTWPKLLLFPLDMIWRLQGQRLSRRDDLRFKRYNKEAAVWMFITMLPALMMLLDEDDEDRNLFVPEHSRRGAQLIHTGLTDANGDPLSLDYQLINFLGADVGIGKRFWNLLAQNTKEVGRAAEAANILSDLGVGSSPMNTALRALFFNQNNFSGLPIRDEAAPTSDQAGQLALYFAEQMLLPSWFGRHGPLANIWQRATEDDPRISKFGDPKDSIGVSLIKIVGINFVPRRRSEMAKRMNWLQKQLIDDVVKSYRKARRDAVLRGAKPDELAELDAERTAQLQDNAAYLQSIVDAFTEVSPDLMAEMRPRPFPPPRP